MTATLVDAPSAAPVPSPASAAAGPAVPAPAAPRDDDPRERLVRVELPTEGRGHALAACVRRTRVALARGGVVVDPRPARLWSPGARLVLEGLRRDARRRGRAWEERPAD